MQHANAIRGTFDCWLVLLSVGIAISASYAALDLAGRVTANRGRYQREWLVGGAMAMGVGIWAMHYAGMMAYRLPLAVYYHLPTVGLSLLTAVLSSFVALYAVSREQIRPPWVIGASVLLGSGISIMQYTGMMAMRLAATPQYDLLLVLISVALAMAVSLALLTLLAYSRERNTRFGMKIAIATVMGVAIPAMQYPGMAAISFVAGGPAPKTSQAVNLSGVASSAIIFTTFAILACAMTTSLVDRRLSDHQNVLQEERNILRTLIDNIPDFMFVKDRQGRYIIANASAARFLGAGDAGNLIGKTAYDLFPKDIAAAFTAVDKAILASEEWFCNREEICTNSRGETVHLLTTKVPIRGARGEITSIAGVGRDISKRKEDEDALREAERKYRGLFDDAIVGMFQSTPEGRFLSVNRALAQIFGFANPEEMIESVTDIGQQLFAEERSYKEFAMVMERLGSILSLECKARCHDGSEIWISCSGRAVRENRVLVRYEGMMEDISERKLLRTQLLQAQKLESIGQLAAGIAHEINSPNQFIADNVSFLKDAFQSVGQLQKSYETLVQASQNATLTPELVEQVEASVRAADLPYFLDEIPKAIDQTLEGTSRVAALVGAMKEFSHPGAKEKIPIDLNHAIASTITVSRHEWKYVADVETDFDASLPRVFCLASELNQVILNLIVNAAHAIGDVVKRGGFAKGKIRIQTRNMKTYVEIRIQDDGTGIPQQVQNRVFDPFFTTKEMGKGTGQGLAIARSVIVDKHEGTIDFETAEGLGTTFIIRLPKESERAAARAAGGAPGRGGEAEGDG